MQVYAKLNKKHTIQSFHRVCESIASGIVGFYFIPGDINPADILSKHWGYWKNLFYRKISPEILSEDQWEINSGS
jgi:hypothetical protein